MLREMCTRALLPAATAQAHVQHLTISSRSCASVTFTFRLLSPVQPVSLESLTVGSRPGDRRRRRHGFR